jgi:hypothetical protein
LVYNEQGKKNLNCVTVSFDAVEQRSAAAQHTSVSQRFAKPLLYARPAEPFGRGSSQKNIKP